jgi:UDP-N-acetylmuramate--alanine ligase
MFLTPNNLTVAPLSGKRNVHLIGANGIGMIGAKNWLEASSINVTGTDLSGGIPETETPVGAEILVVSSAISDTHPQYQWALSNGIPVIHRSECIRQLIPPSVTIAVCGAHGKTTSSALLAHLLTQFTNACSFMVGGFVTSLGSSAKLIKPTKYCVLETDESDGSMLNMIGRYSMITNVDNEHIEYYGSFEKYLASMKAFAAGSEKCFIHTSCKSYGFSGDNLVWYGSEDLQLHPSLTEPPMSDFIAVGPWGELPIRTNLLGDHMAQNILGCLSVLFELSKVDSSIKFTGESLNSGFASFQGIKKRGEVTRYMDLVLVNDYAHHPTEIAATIKAYRDNYRGRLKVIWEPHRYSRLRLNGLDSFKSSFILSDEVVVLPIHSASEAPDPEFTQEGLAGFIGGRAIDASQVHEYVKAAEPGDIIVCMGAGSSYKVFNDAIENLIISNSV